MQNPFWYYVDRTKTSSAFALLLLNSCGNFPGCVIILIMIIIINREVGFEKEICRDVPSSERNSEGCFGIYCQYLSRVLCLFGVYKTYRKDNVGGHSVYFYTEHQSFLSHAVPFLSGSADLISTWDSNIYFAQYSQGIPVCSSDTSSTSAEGYRSSPEQRDGAIGLLTVNRHPWW